MNKMDFKSIGMKTETSKFRNLGAVTRTQPTSSWANNSSIGMETPRVSKKPTGTVTFNNNDDLARGTLPVPSRNRVEKVSRTRPGSTLDNDDMLMNI